MMSKIKNIFAILMFVLMVGAAHSVSAQSSDDSAAAKPALFAVAAPKPGYPVSAIVAGVEGDAQVDVKINAKGAVVGVEFVGGSELFQKSVLEYAEMWKFNATDASARIRQARLTFTFTKNDEAKLNADETKYKYHTLIHVLADGDSFNGGSETDKP